MESDIETESYRDCIGIFGYSLNNGESNAKEHGKHMESGAM